MADESYFWSKRLRPLLSPLGKFDRIENGLLPGMPDVVYTVQGFTSWIELKYRPEAPVRSTSKVFTTQHKGLSKEQVLWWREHLAARGTGLFVWGMGPSFYGTRVTAPLLLSFNDMTVARADRYAVTAAGLRDLVRR